MRRDDEVSVHEHERPLGEEGPPVSRAIQILAIDEEIAALERIRPKARLYSALLIPLALMLSAFTVFVSGADDAGTLLVLSLIWPVLVVVTVPSALYGITLLRNRRHRLRLERELDALIEYHEGPRLSSGRGNWGGEEGGMIL